MSADTQYTGQCKCGHIKFTATGNPAYFGWCHCYMCRTDCSSAGVFEVNFGDRFTHNVTDEMLQDGSVFKKVVGAKKSFAYYRCTKCDTRVFDNNTVKNTYTTYPSLFDFARHTSNGDDAQAVKSVPDLWKPTGHIFWSMRLGGVMEQDNGLPHYTTDMSSDVMPVSRSVGAPASDDRTVHTAQCKCGNIQFSVTGNPLFTSLCHCSRCRIADAAEYRVASTFDSANFTTNIDSVDKSTYINPLFGGGFDHLKYWRCTKCDTRVYHYNAKLDKYMVYPSLFEFGRGDSNNEHAVMPERWWPDAHIFYGSRLDYGLYADDGLKYYVGLRGKEQCDYTGKSI